MRTAEQQKAIFDLQEALVPRAYAFVDQMVAELAEVPAENPDREINNVGHLLFLMLKRSAPHLSEAMQYALPFAFVELVRERISQPRL